jgi:hypothetical protein
MRVPEPGTGDAAGIELADGRRLLSAVLYAAIGA